ncbi:MAG: HAMP domain-containing sensor histidine kinase [Campylobacterota bacterium]|nr:HAMP domain-containing sensor histidine kinase [Campylobacterota bacterium]
MLSSQLKNHEIKLNISGESSVCNGFQSEYQQVILNIINNAKDALVENKIDNAKIDIVFKNSTVSIKDNAGGIPQDVVDRIFEPYFTTKEQGKGTGMGLYMSKMIIEDNMGGSLHVSNGDDGAIFIIDLNNLS